MTLNESHGIFKTLNINNSVVPKKENLKHLPPIVQKWLTVSGVFQTSKTVSVRLKQKGGNENKSFRKMDALYSPTVFQL